MNIGITGASGFIGGAIINAGKDRHEFVGYSRSPDRAIEGTKEVRDFSNPAAADYSGLDAVIHLAGESILGLWTDGKKKRILNSRVEGTRGVVDGIGQLEPAARPKALVCASAVGFYGDRGDEVLDEESDYGFGFLCGVTRAWEAEAAKASSLGLRVGMGRVGLVLGKGGGAAPQLKRIFGLGLGGEMGSGDQWWPWVHIDDIGAMFLEVAENEALSGPMNFTGPEPVTNETFTEAVGSVLRRPTIFKVPKFALNLAPGGMGEIFLNSQRVDPQVLRLAGYEWKFSDVGEALRDAL